MKELSLHLLDIAQNSIAAGARHVDLGVEEIWTGHCTGKPAFDLLTPILGSRLHYLATGAVVRLWEDGK